MGHTVLPFLSEVPIVAAIGRTTLKGRSWPGGIILRYALRDNSPSGVTIVGFARNGWDQNLKKLSGIIGHHLNIDPGSISIAPMRETKRSRR